MINYNHQAIKYSGATVDNNNPSVILYPTSTATLTTLGATTLTARVYANGQHLSVSVDDGSPTTVIVPSSSGAIATITLVSGLSTLDPHTIEITGSTGATAFLSFDINSGSFQFAERVISPPQTIVGGAAWKFWAKKFTGFDLYALENGAQIEITLDGQWPGTIIQTGNTGTYVRYRVIWNALQSVPHQISVSAYSGIVKLQKAWLNGPYKSNPTAIDSDTAGLIARPVLLTYGDSITAGQGSTGAQGWAQLLAASMGWRLSNAGVGGQNAYCYGQNSAWKLALTNPAPDRIIVAFGANDIIPGAGFDFGKCDPTIDQYQSALDAIITQIQSDFPEVQIYMSAILPINRPDTSDSLRNQWIARQQTVCDAHSIKLFDGSSALTAFSDYVDGLHPNGIGHQKLAAAWKSFLQVQPIAVSGHSDVGPLDRPNNIARDGGYTTYPFGGQIFWIFGDSIISGQASDNSHALSPLNNPTQVDRGVPDQYIPHTDLETTWNNAHSPTDRYALWPTGVIRQADGSIILFFARIHITPQNWINTGIWWATATSSDTTATRGDAALFTSGTLFGSAGVCMDRGKNYIYLYSDENTGFLTYGQRIARVKISQFKNVSMYRYWDGSSWQSNPAKAILIINPGSSSGLTVSWNLYLRKYLATYSKPLTSDIYMRTADKPQGPWSAEIKAFTGQAAGGTGLGANDYAGFEHSELATSGGKVVTVSYAHPLGSLNGEMRLTTVTFD